MKKIVNPLLKWYKNNKRMLPWRLDKEPYHVWVSEIMLQQTRIEAVKQYYKKFMENIPTIYDLSVIPEDKLLKYWEGLGYYNRARNLKKAATQIVEKYQGEFPTQYEDILKLPGIGEYTAGAISSICFSLKEVAIDGNVLRVYMRLNNCYDNIDDVHVKKEVAKSIKAILPKNSGDFNEGIMELGEVICFPTGEPKCKICPLKKHCQSYLKGTMLDLPIRSPKKIPKEERYTVYLYIYKDMVAIEKKETGLLQKLWQFPNENQNHSLRQVKEKINSMGVVTKKIHKNIENCHVFSHRIWKMQAYIIEVDTKIHGYNWVTVEQIKKEYAVATAFQPFLKEVTNFIENK